MSVSAPAPPAAGLDLRGTSVIVTGASGNLGAGIARRFAAAGADVLLHHHRGEDAAVRLARELIAAGGRAVAAGADLTDPTGPARLIEAALSHFGRLDALVNNAGIQPVTPLAELAAARWRAVIEVNLTSVFACTQLAAAVMAEHGGGSITHIASIEGSRPAPGHAAYSASKAGVIMHARAAAFEYGPAGVRVNTVSPGLIDRDGLDRDWPEGVARWRAAAPLRRLGTPADVGDACVFLASPLARWITGHDLVVDGGVSTHPSW
jgi:NAD(P)-dependent dehydrogenase (short-subunit alcohol dehydrogenase family)